MFPDEIGLHILGRLPAERDAAGPQIAAVDGLAGDFVDGVAVALGPFAGDAQIEPVIDDREC